MARRILRKKSANFISDPSSVNVRIPLANKTFHIRHFRYGGKLQLDCELTKAVTLVRQAEAVKQQQPLLRGQNHPAGVKKPDTPVGAVLKGRSGYGRRSKTKTKASQKEC